MICLFLQKPVSRLISLAKLLIIYSPWKQCPPDLREHLFSWINYRRKEEGFSPLVFNFSLDREAHALAVAQHETVFPQWNSYSPIQPTYFTRFLPYAQYAASRTIVLTLSCNTLIFSAAGLASRWLLNRQTMRQPSPLAFSLRQSGNKRPK